MPTTLPKQVQDANDRADELLKEVGGKEKSENTNEGDAPKLAPVPDTPNDNGTADPATPEPQAPAAGPTEQEQLNTLGQKFSVLEGKYNAEVPALHGDLREANQKNADLEAEIARLKETPPETTDDGLDSYPDDLINYVRGLKEKVEQQGQTIQSLQSTSANTAQQGFDIALTELVSDWRDINGDQGFIQWLKATREQSSGMLQMDNLTSAHQAGDVPRVAFIFDLWKAHSTRVNNPNQGAQQPTGNQPPVVPSSNNVDQPPAGEGRMWTLADINAWNVDVALGRTEMTPDEITRINKDIDAAQFQGRVTQ